MKNHISYRRGRQPQCGIICFRAVLFLTVLAGLTAGCGSSEEPVFTVQEEAVFTASEEKTAEESGFSGVKEEQSDAEKIPDLTEAAHEEPRIVYVYVTGAVNNPGVYALREGDRMIDAANAAGGLTEEADRVWINLAAEVADGMRIRFPTEEEAASFQNDPAALVSTGPDPRYAEEGAVPDFDSRFSEGKVNINTADAETLMTLNGIGKAKAEAVIAYREEHGRFRSIEEIREVNGIKDSVFERIKESITVE